MISTLHMTRGANSLLLFGVWCALGSSDQEPAFIGTRGRYWAFQKVVRPLVPSISDAWVRNPIDAFILQDLKKKLEPSKPSRSRTTDPPGYLRSHRPAAHAG